MDIVADGIVGHSLGEGACAYADGCFTAEETILSAYARGRSSLDTELIPGMMAAVGNGNVKIRLFNFSSYHNKFLSSGLSYNNIKDQLPHDIDVACHNSSTSCTLSGPKDSIEKFVSTLAAKNIFAKAVNVSGIAFHSRYIQSIGPLLHKHLKKVCSKIK